MISTNLGTHSAKKALNSASHLCKQEVGIRGLRLLLACQAAELAMIGGYNIHLLQ